MWPAAIVRLFFFPSVTLWIFMESFDFVHEALHGLIVVEQWLASEKHESNDADGPDVDLFTVEVLFVII